MRLFIAIDIPVFNDILELQQTIKKITKATCPKSFHLTLKFLGEVPEKELESIVKRLEKITFSEFKLETFELGCFPNLKKINVIWLGFKENNDLIELQKKIDFSLKEYKNNQEFKPHITIARTIHNDALKEIIKTKLKPEIINVNSFKLYQSTLTNLGPIYNLIREFKANKIS